jgi:uncharacterized protein YjbI with pentapeptide repeats
VNSLPLVYDSQNNLMDEEHPAKRKNSRWWPTSRGAMRIFAALIAVGALLVVFRGYLPEPLRERPLAVLGAATVVVAAVVVLVRVGQHYQWTGFGESVRPKADNQEIQPRKTLWDWLQLFIVPLALAAIGLWFSAQQEARQQQLEEQRAQNAALEAYLDQMSQLMLEGDLLSSEADNAVRTLARARTQTVLGRLDSDRKASVVQFLYEASLINKEPPVLNLSDVDLRGANLSELNLRGVNLTGADLRGADLQGTNLSDAILRGAILRKANLDPATLSGAEMDNADLKSADLSGATMNYANLYDAELPLAIMSHTKLGYASLKEANLSGADLRGADLHNADLKGAIGVTEEQLEEAKTLEGATMPGGSTHH